MTEREKVRLQRQAYERGLRAALGDDCPTISAITAARLTYPMPRITQPRVVTAGYHEYRVVNGAVEYRAIAAAPSWFPSTVTVEQLRALGSLPDHPTEEVEDEDE